MFPQQNWTWTLGMRISGGCLHLLQCWFIETGDSSQKSWSIFGWTVVTSISIRYHCWRRRYVWRRWGRRRGYRRSCRRLCKNPHIFIENITHIPAAGGGVAVPTDVAALLLTLSHRSNWLPFFFIDPSLLFCSFSCFCKEPINTRTKISKGFTIRFRCFFFSSSLLIISWTLVSRFWLRTTFCSPLSRSSIFTTTVFRCSLTEEGILKCARSPSVKCNLTRAKNGSSSRPSMVGRPFLQASCDRTDSKILPETRIEIVDKLINSCLSLW